MKNVLNNLWKFPWVYLNLSMLILSGFLEGLGIALFIPVLQNFSVTKIDSSKLTFLSAFLSRFNLPNSQLALLAVSCLAITTSFCLIYLQRILLIKSRYAYLTEIGKKILFSTFYSDWPRLSILTKGEVVSKLSVENYRGAQALVHLMNFLSAFIQISIYLILSLMISPKMVFLSLGSYFLLWLASKPLLKKMTKCGKDSSLYNDHFATNVIDNLGLAKVFKVFKKENYITNNLIDSYGNVLNFFKSYDLADALMALATQIIPVITIYAIFVYSLVYDGLEISSLLILVMIYSRMGSKMALLNQSFGGYLNNHASLQYLDSFLEKNNLDNSQINSNNKLGLKEIEEIKLVNISYQYPNTHIEQLKNVNVTLKRGKIYSMIGPSGSGKSTLMDVILGLRKPNRGRILVNGEERELEYQARVVGYVPQDGFIYKDSIRNNITLSDYYEDSHVWEVLELVGLKKDIEGLPKKLDTMIGEGDLGLSGGQKQRLAIARSLVINPSLLVLDEATSGLDKNNEDLLGEILQKIKSRCLVLLITHRPEFAERSDYIIRVNQGEVSID